MAYLRADGLEVNIGKHISVEMDDMTKAMRTNQLGENYTAQAIVRRLATKMDPLIWKSVGEHSHYLPQKELVNFTPTKMKKYQDMSREEKKAALRLIRLGRNPWEETYIDNWQIQRMAKELNETAYIYELVHYYSAGKDDVDMAKAEILERKNALTVEMKQLRENLKIYQPIINLYEELKTYMVRAYMFDVYGRTEYIADFLKYKELSDRLMVSYGKTVEEVADFIADQRGQLLYAKSQASELSAQYRAINRFSIEGRFVERKDILTFLEAVGHTEALRQAREYNIYTSEIRYITAKNVDDVIIRVMTMPETVNGKATVATKIEVINGKEKVIKSVESKDMSAGEFNRQIFDLAEEYGLKECSIHKNNIRKKRL